MNFQNDVKVDSKEKLNNNYNAYNYAAIYVRKSTQADNYSLDSQEDHCKKQLVKEELLLHNIYKDEASATKPYATRKGFSKLLNDIYAGMFKTLIVARMDRLSRNIDDFIKLKSIFKKHNIKVIYVSESVLNTACNNTYMKNFMESMLMALSTFEPQNIAERTAKGRKESREKGRYKLCKYPAFGFKYQDEETNDYNKKVKQTTKLDKEYVVNEEQAKIVSQLFNDYVDKVDKIFKNKVYTMSDLIKDINNHPNTKLSKSNVKEIIKKPIYAQLMLIDASYTIEQMIYRDENTNELKIDDTNLVKCENVKGPIISFDLWKKAVIKLFKDKVPELEENESYLFKDLVYCGKCKTRVKLINNLYKCSHNCTNLDKIEMIKLILKQIIFDLKNETIKEQLSDDIRFIKKEILSLKNDLKVIDNNLREILNKYIENPDNKPNENKYKNTMSNKINKAEEINEKGLMLRELTVCLEEINKFKEQITNFNNKKYLDYILDNENLLHEIISNLVKKVVFQNQLSLYGYCEIKFKSKG